MVAAESFVERLKPERWYSTFVKGREKSMALGALPSKTSKNGDYSLSFKKWKYQKFLSKKHR
jgi:hypothetical protein